MSTDTPQPPSPPAPLSFFRRFAPIAAVGAAGLLSLLLRPVPEGLFEHAPSLAALPPLTQRAMLLVNPLLLLVAAALAGAALAHRVGLGSLLAGTAGAKDWRRSVAGAAAWGCALGVGLAAADAAIAPHLGAQWQRLAADAPRGAAALAVGLLYGGVAEEVMLRWGLMSVVAWALVSVFRPANARGAMAFAIVMSAFVFGAAHLPALAAQIEPTPALVARTLVINGAAGLVYGWLFWRRHLEAAMAAHAATHLGMAAWRAVGLL